MEKDWIGTKSTFRTLGASNHCDHEREKNDYYATEPKAVELLLDLEDFFQDIWEPACGENHITNVLRNKGYNVRTSDIVDRINDGSVEVKDFLQQPSGEEYKKINRDIITNPPYKYAKEFVEKSLDLIADGRKVAMFLKLTFLEGKNRKKMFQDNPPKIIYVSSSRLKCAINGDFDSCGTSATAYAWFVWEKGYKGDTVVKWFN